MFSFHARHTFKPIVPHVDFFDNEDAPILTLFSPTSGTALVDHSKSRVNIVGASLDTRSNNYANGNYQFTLDRDYGPSDYDATHAFKVFGVWSPTLSVAITLGWKVVGGWSLSES
jgi:hypothetical protein